MRVSIVKSRSGKSAIASAAYQSGDILHSDRLGKTFQYSGKEEIVHSEILLPQNAPHEYIDRETLWNAVEEVQNKSNSRYARQFVIAIPNEWTRDEAIERAREYLQNSFVERGMAVDWAYHEKDGNQESQDNHHIHALCTVRGFNQDGTWASMEKKEFALDSNGERIPIIDPKTGEQKVRVRERNGHHSEEKLWKRVTVQANEWNSRDFLKQVKQEWADTCNRHLSIESQIDPRSHQERGLETLPLLHEGSKVREMSLRGIETDVHQENLERKKYNETVSRLQAEIEKSRAQLDQTVKKIIELEAPNGPILRRKENIYGSCAGNYCQLSGSNYPVIKRDQQAGKSNNATDHRSYENTIIQNNVNMLTYNAGELYNSPLFVTENAANEIKHRHKIRH